MNIHQGKTSDRGRQSLYQLLERSDKVALEAGNLAFIKRGTFAVSPLG